MPDPQLTELEQLIRKFMPSVCATCGGVGVSGFDSKNATLRVGMRVLSGDVIEISSLYATPTGTGLGSEFVEGIRNFADKEKMDVRFIRVENQKFFRRFPFLSEEEGGKEFVYEH